MSTHPNVLLVLALTPDDLSRKTYRAILEEAGVGDDDDIKIGAEDYHHEVMESDYQDDYQISGKEGDIVFFDLVTYGYGETITWDELAAQTAELDAWAAGICERHRCSARVYISANYW